VRGRAISEFEGDGEAPSAASRYQKETLFYRATLSDKGTSIFRGLRNAEDGRERLVVRAGHARSMQGGAARQ